MSTSKEEIKAWLKDASKTRDDIANECGVSKNTVNGWLSNAIIPDAKLRIIETMMGKNKAASYPDYAAKAPLRNFPEIETVAVLFTDEEFEQIKNAANKEGISVEDFIALSAIEDAGQIINIHSDILDPIKSIKEKTEPEQLPKKEFLLPVLGNVAAGGLMEGDIPEAYNIISSEDFGKNHYCLRINGKSMEPDIPDGSHVIVKKWEESHPPKPGTVVVYYDGRGVTLKRLIKIKLPNRDSEYVLQSINPEFDDITPIDGGSVSAVFVKVVK